MSGRKRRGGVKSWDHLTNPAPCIECRATDATCVTGAEIYPHRRDLHRRRYWRCSCGAYVGCHPGTTAPLGAPAGAHTRAARNEAHAAFDPLWKRKIIRDGVPQYEARKAGYAWLAREMGLTVEQCHISLFNADQARRVVEICKRLRRVSPDDSNLTGRRFT